MPDSKPDPIAYTDRDSYLPANTDTEPNLDLRTDVESIPDVIRELFAAEAQRDALSHVYTDTYGDPYRRDDDPGTQRARAYWDTITEYKPDRHPSRAERVTDLARDLEGVNWPWRDAPGGDGE